MRARFLFLAFLLFSLNLQSQTTVQRSVDASIYAGRMSESGAVSGSQTLEEARFNSPSSIYKSPYGLVFITEDNGRTIKRITSNGNVVTLAGKNEVNGFADGFGSLARFGAIYDIADENGLNLLVVDGGNNRIRRVSIFGEVSTVAGGEKGFNDGPIEQAQFSNPTGVVVDSEGIIYVADKGNHRIRRIDTNDGVVSTIAGDGSAAIKDGPLFNSQLNSPNSLFIDKDGYLIVSSAYAIHKIDLENETMSTIAGTNESGFINGAVNDARFLGINDLIGDAYGNIWVADKHSLRLIKSASTVETVIGFSGSGAINGDANDARFNDLSGLTPFENGFLVTDKGNHVVRQIKIETNLSGVLSSEVVWTEEYSPYRLTDDLVIEVGGKLTITKGVEVIANSNQLIVDEDGKIDVKGEENYTVKFRLDDKDDYFIRIQNSNCEEDCSFNYFETKLPDYVSKGYKFLVVDNELESEVVTAGSQKSLVLENSFLERSLLDVRSKNQRIELRNTNSSGATFFISNENAGYSIVDSDVGHGNFIEKTFPVDATGVGLLEFSNASLINTPVYVPNSLVKLDNTFINTSVNDLPRTDLIPNLALVTAAGADIFNTYFNGPDGYGSVKYDGIIIGSDKELPVKVERSIFKQLNKGVVLGDFGTAKIIGNQFLLFEPIGEFMINNSSKDVNARGNYFDGLTTQEEIELKVYHKPDDQDHGFIDFSQFKTGDADPSLIAPIVRKKRLIENGYFSNQVKLLIEEVPEGTKAVRVYSRNANDSIYTSFITEIVMPDNEAVVDMSWSGYAVTTVNEEGEEGLPGSPYNRAPTFDKETRDTTYQVNQDAYMEFSTFDEDEDDIYVDIGGAQGGYGGFGGFQWLKSAPYVENISKDGTESKKAFRMQAYPDGLGEAKIRLRASDGFNSVLSELVLTYVPLNEYPPLITGMDTISGLIEDHPRSMTSDELIQKIHFEDGDEESTASLIITELLTGTLTVNENEISVPYEFEYNTNLRWLPPSDSSGIIAGFKMKISDGYYQSEDDAIAVFEVSEVNDLPSFNFVPDPVPAISQGGANTLAITGISDGPNENEPLNLSYGISNESIFKPGSISVEYDEATGTGAINYSLIKGAVGTAFMNIYLSDPLLTYSQEVQISLLPESIPPEINVSEHVVAYTDYPFNLDYTIKDDQGYFAAIGSSESSWIEIDNRKRIGNLTQSKRYNSPSVNGLLKDALLASASSMVLDKHGNIWLSTNRTISLITPEGVVYTAAGNGDYGNRDGQGKYARFSFVTDMVYDEVADEVYFVYNWNIIKKIDSSFNVTTVFQSTESSNVHGNFGPLDLDSDGNLYFGNSYFYGNYSNILRLTKQGELSVFAGSESPYNAPNNGQRDNVSIYDINALKIVNDNLYFTGGGLFRKIDQNGIVSVISIEDGLSNDGYESYIEVLDDSHLLVFQKEVDKIVKVNIDDLFIEYISGNSTPRVFEDGMLASEVDFGYFGIDFNNFLPTENGILISLNGNDDSYYSIIRNHLDSIKGTASLAEIGEHEVTITAKDFEGNTSTKTITIEVRENNKIETSNISQTISFDEDTPLVDIEDIVLSGLPATEQAKVTIEVDVNTRSAFTADSGNGESFDTQTGTWTITGSQSDVNTALASLALIPGADYDQDFSATVTVVNAAGGVPNIGVIEFKVNPVADLPRLVTSITDSAYVEIPYEFEFDLEDPDSYLFNLRVNSYPEWMELSSELWAETYSGQYDYYGGNVNGSLEQAKFNKPRQLKVDNQGNLYVMESSFVRKISNNGSVTNFLRNSYGFADGDISNAYFNSISDMAFHKNGDIYVADGNNHRIRKIDVNGNVTTIAGNGEAAYLDGNALEASFNYPKAIELAENGDLYILDNGRVRKLGVNGQVSTIAGNGTFGQGEGSALDTPFYSLVDLEIDKDGNLIIADSYTVRKLDLTNNEVSLIAGNGNSCCNMEGPISETFFRGIRAIEVVNNIIYAVTDDYFFELNLDTNQAQELARYTSGTSDYTNEGVLGEVTFNEFWGLASYGDNLFLSDYRRNVIRRVYANNIKLSGIPRTRHIGENQVNYTIVDASQQEHQYTSTIDVRANLMPVISGMDIVYSGVENQESIDLSKIAVSDVVSDSVHITIKLGNPNAGSFNEDLEKGAMFNSEPGILEIKSTEVSANEFFSKLSFEPALNYYGSLSVNVEAKNYNTNFTRTEHFKIKIERANTDPELDDLTQITAMVDLPMEFVVPVVDEDHDPIDLKIEGLPDWLELKMEAIVEVGTEADMEKSYSSSNIGEGSVENQFLYYFGARGLTFDSQGFLYFTNYNKVQRLHNGNVVTIAQKEGLGSVDYLNEVVIVEDEIFTSDRTAIYKVIQGKLQIIAGGTEQVDRDGRGTEAGFLDIRDFVSDENGGFYVADESTIRYLDSDGNVTTIAGNGGYGFFSEGGNALELPLQGISHLQLDQNGELIFGIRNQNKICRYKNGQIEILFTQLEYPLSVTQFNVDRLGNAFTFTSNAIYLYDTIQGRKEYVNASNLNNFQVSDGVEDQFQWETVSSVIRKSSNKLYLLDRGAGDIRSISYDFEYTLVGTPPKGSEGVKELSFKLNDGYGGKVEYFIPLNVQKPDRPEIIGFPQEFSFTEDDEPFALDPISIESQDNDMEFEVEIHLGGDQFGALIAEGYNLSDSLNTKGYFMRGTAPELNQILGGLYFRPGSDNDADSFIDFKFKQLNGLLSATHQIPLSVTAINDAPQILNLRDTVSFVGDSLAVVVDAFDVEDKRSLTFEAVKPEWLNFIVAKSKSELYAGNPNGKGFYYDKSSHVGLYESQFITFDYRGDIILTDAATHSVVRVDSLGEISLVAGTGRMGYKNGLAANAEFHNPTGVAADSKGNIYVADAGNNVIRLIDKEGNVSTLVGTGERGNQNGAFLYASFDNIQNLELSKDETKLYVQQDKRIRRIDLEKEYVVTALNTYQFQNPIESFDVNDDGEFLLAINNTIAKYSAFGSVLLHRYSNHYGQVDGPYGVGSIADPYAVRAASDGTIYFVDRNFLRKITIDGSIQTLGGGLYYLGYSDGIENQIGFTSGKSILFKNDAIYLSGRSSLRRIMLDVPIFYGTPDQSDIGQHQISIKATDKEGEMVSQSFDIQVFSNDRLQVSGLDTAYFIKESTSEISLPEVLIDSDVQSNIELTIALEAGLTGELFSSDGEKIEMDADKSSWYFVGTKAYLNAMISTLKLRSSKWKQGSLLFDFKRAGGRLNIKKSIPVFVEPENDLPTLVSNTTYSIEVGEPFEINFEGHDEDGDFLVFDTESLPSWIAVDSALVFQAYINTIYSDNLPDTIKAKRRVYVNDIAVTPAGDTLIAGGALNKLFKLENGQILDFAGTGERGYLDGPKAQAEFRGPNDILVRANGDVLVADVYYGLIRKIGADGVISTVLDTAPLYPYHSHTGFDPDTGDPIPFRITGLTEDNVGNLYTAEMFSIGKVDTEGVYSHYAGHPAFTYNFEDQVGDLPDARFANIRSVIALGNDSLLVWDAQNFKVKIIANSQVSTIAGANGIGFKDGELEEAQFGFVSDAELLNNGNVLFFDQSNLTLRLLDLKNNTVSSMLGKGYQGAVYGYAEDAVLDPITAIEELSNGDILLGGSGRIDRLTSSDRRITGVPSSEDVGQYKFTLKVSDGKGGVVSEEITINVLAPNTAPAALDIPSQEETYAPEGHFEVSLFDYFSDAESTDQELTYEVVSIDSEAVVTAEAISSTDGVLNLNVQGAGEANVTLKATDTRGKSVTTTFAVNIAKAEAEIMLGELEFVNSEAETPVTVTTVPSGLNYTLTYDEESAVPSTVGEYIVKVVIDDANYQGETTATLKVLNIVPEDIQISGLTVLENSASATVIGLLSTTDQNSTDTHTYELESGVADNDSFEINGSNLVVKDVLDFEEKSTYSITVTATDNYEGSYSKTFSISVTDVNEEPTINEVEAIEIVRNLGELSLTVTGLSAGEEANQTIELSSSVSGIVESSSISINSDNESATLNFQTIQDQTGSGTIEVTVKDNGGTANGGVDTKTITISVDVLGANIAVKDEGSCGPGSINLSASGADDYNWYTSALEGTSFATSSSIEVNVSETKTYYVAGIFSGIESKLRIPVTASLYSIPDVPTVTNNQGTLTTTEVSDISYQWTLDGEEIEGATSSAFEPVFSGQYTLRATNANGCSVTSESVEVVLAGIEDSYQEISAKIYPVPATDVLELEFEETLKKGTTIKLLSNIGTEFSQTTLQQATRQVSLDVSYLPEGTHIVLVRSENKLLRKKFIVIR
ncbi:MAG: hypothetical protein JJ978_05260 [Roseivirga sp.]|uniref:NHL domain-containing protein n=1 Tax=Roseivirga sp. TaxID=1964215 RepID=UPI001B25176B|nr:MBG domain-containing protein [Roseivirga sp.]MBO6494953.1 hypothetical protein [Roseivirga sp.]